MELGLQAFDVLDSVGRRITTRWLNPADFMETPGEWAGLASSGSRASSASDESGLVEFVRQQFDYGVGRMEPVLNSLGEPLVASAEGTFMNLAPVAGGLASAGIGAGIDAIGSMFSVFRPEGGSPSMESVIYNPASGSVDIQSSSTSSEEVPEDTRDQQNNDEVDRNKSEDSETNEGKDHEDTDKDEPENSEDKEDKSDEGEDHQTAETTAPETTAHETTAHEMTARETTAPGPNAATATPDKSTPKADTSYPPKIDAPDTATPTPTTLSTVTTSNKPKTPTSTSITSTKLAETTFNKPTLSGCQTNSDCPVCIFPCQIGELPRECVRNAEIIQYVHHSGKYTWDDCVKEIWKLDRVEAKAWANAITLPYCVSENEWEPRDFDKEHGGECWLDIRGDKFAKVKDIWITGMLPLNCPRYVEALKNDPECGHAIDVLSKPWKKD
jgi:hypothetical protein